MTRNPTPAPAGAQEGSERASGANCDHFYAWVSPAGSVHGVRICFHCHMPDPDALNSLLRETAERAWNEGWFAGRNRAEETYRRNPYAAKEADRG